MPGSQQVPTSPNLTRPTYYASTGILGALSVVSIGIGYTLPFKVIGAPWIKPNELAQKLNAQKLPGVHFMPFDFKPFYGKFKNLTCHGVKIVITNHKIYKPLAVQYMLIGILKSLYPLHFRTKLDKITPLQKSSFCKVNGNSDILEMIQKEKYVAWKLIGYDKQERQDFREKRKPYLIYQ